MWALRRSCLRGMGPGRQRPWSAASLTPALAVTPTHAVPPVKRRRTATEVVNELHRASEFLDKGVLTAAEVQLPKEQLMRGD